MKKILFVIMLIASSIFSFAGIIVTTSGERIEDVTIVSETDSAIVYIQDGVEKSIAIEQVQAVLFDNGNYKEYPKYTSPVTTNEFMTSSEQTNLYVQQPQRQRSQRQSIDRSAFDPDGKKLLLSGWITGGLGLSCILVGAILVGTSYYYEGYITGIALLGVGAGATAVSIPLLVVGDTRKQRFANFSAKTAQSYILELQVQKNQLGLALKF